MGHREQSVGHLEGKEGQKRVHVEAGLKGSGGHLAAGRAAEGVSKLVSRCGGQGQL